jgi:hypothetical protein
LTELGLGPNRYTHSKTHSLSALSSRLGDGPGWASLRRIHPNRLKNRTMPLPRAKRPEQLKGFFTLAPKHVVDIDRARIGVFAEQKVDQGEKSLERLVVRTLRKRAFGGA